MSGNEAIGYAVAFLIGSGGICLLALGAGLLVHLFIKEM